MNLIKDINNSLKPKDPVKEALNQVNEMQLGDEEMTRLDDDQVNSIAEYMKEMLDASAKRGGSGLDVQEAAYLALEDIAGFETCPKKILHATAARLMRAYKEKYG